MKVGRKTERRALVISITKVGEDDGGETHLAKRRHHESDLVWVPVRIGLGRCEPTVLDEVGVDDGVKEVIVDGVINVCVLIVVAPSRCPM